jgi:hypothetical protein
MHTPVSSPAAQVGVRTRGAHAVPLGVIALLCSVLFTLLTVDVLGDARGVLDLQLMHAIQRVDGSWVEPVFRPVDILTGLLVGVALALLFFPVALGLWREADVALAVALALLAACSIATLVAMTLPWLFHGLGIDPAFGSGPLATVVQDLLSILIYCIIGAALVDSGP